MNSPHCWAIPSSLSCHFNLLWQATCFFKELLNAKRFPHWRQWNLFCWVCVAWWSMRWELVVKHLPQTKHRWGRTSVWTVLTCLFIELRSLNLLSQYAHFSGFSFVWVLTCCFKLKAFLNSFPHVPQVRPDEADVQDFASWEGWSCWWRRASADTSWSADMVTTAVSPASPPSSSPSSRQSATLLWSFCLSFLARLKSSSRCSKHDSIRRSMSGLASTPLAKASRIMEVPKLIWKCRIVIKIHQHCKYEVWYLLCAVTAYDVENGVKTAWSRYICVLLEEAKTIGRLARTLGIRGGNWGGEGCGTFMIWLRTSLKQNKSIIL